MPGAVKTDGEKEVSNGKTKQCFILLLYRDPLLRTQARSVTLEGGSSCEHSSGMCLWGGGPEELGRSGGCGQHMCFVI